MKSPHRRWRTVTANSRSGARPWRRARPRRRGHGTGSYGAGLSRALVAQDFRVIEMNRPNRHLRRQRGKSDAVDAEAAARAVLAGRADAPPKSGDGEVEMIRHLKIARDTALRGGLRQALRICPIPASSGKTTRHRLNRGGNRRANAALYRVAVVRMRSHLPTIAFV